jgi:DNA-directed RNA polymerase specialized sigma24 family protein
LWASGLAFEARGGRWRHLWGIGIVAFVVVGSARLRRVAGLLVGRSDEALLASAWAGQRSVSVLVGRYQRPLGRYAAQLLDDAPGGASAVGEALGADAILAAEHAGAPSARAVLYGLVHRQVAAQVATRPGGRNSTQSVVRSPQRGFLGALGELDFEQHAALLLREVEGLSREELAHVLDLSVAQAKRLLVEARMALAEASAPPGQGRWRARLRRAVARRRGR